MTFRILPQTARQLVLWLTLANLGLPSFAQSLSEPDESNIQVQGDEQSAAAPMLQYVAPRNVEMLLGLRLTSGDGSMQNTIATTVFPTEWPEQKVEIVEVSVPPYFKHSLRDLPGGNQQLVLFAQLVPPQTTLEATIRVRVEKMHTVGPTDTAGLTVPKRIPRDLALYTKDSPYIQVTGEVKAVVKEIDKTAFATEWERIEAFYDWVRDNIRYERGDLKSVRDALRDGTGDCEEMTSTFVALCRAARIPARCVWIPNHCYPEFYMEDEQKNGYWFPCQAAGTRNFGSMPEYLPILQKGDRFVVPEKREAQRYIADYLSSKKVNGKQSPQV
ncbi:MAG: transglutaminase domain-containing protein, partial [Planctomycetales bacterium]|nr:transglutaminase domain-containing protein [Planctomycetales bacterium]